MKTEDKNNVPKVRIAVIGKSNVGKSGKHLLFLLLIIFLKNLLNEKFVILKFIFSFNSSLSN